MRSSKIPRIVEKPPPKGSIQPDFRWFFHWFRRAIPLSAIPQPATKGAEVERTCQNVRMHSEDIQSECQSQV